jgi:hypothetical protein
LVGRAPKSSSPRKSATQSRPKSTALFLGTAANTHEPGPVASMHSIASALPPDELVRQLYDERTGEQTGNRRKSADAADSDEGKHLRLEVGPSSSSSEYPRRGQCAPPLDRLLRRAPSRHEHASRRRRAALSSTGFIGD